MNRPDGPRKITELQRLEKKYTKAGLKVLMHKCYYYISRKNWLPTPSYNRDKYKKHQERRRRKRQVQPKAQIGTATQDGFIVPFPIPIMAHDKDWGSGNWNELDASTGGRHTLMALDSKNSGAPHEPRIGQGSGQTGPKSTTTTTTTPVPKKP